MKHAISFHGAASIDSITFDHIYAPLAPSVISAAQPAVDAPDMEACSLSRTFFVLNSLAFISPPCQSISFSIHRSVWTSLIISKHAKIDVLDTEVCSVSHSVCVQAFLLSSIIFPFEIDSLDATWPIKSQLRSYRKGPNWTFCQTIVLSPYTPPLVALISFFCGSSCVPLTVDKRNSFYVLVCAQLSM